MILKTNGAQNRQATENDGESLAQSCSLQIYSVNALNMRQREELGTQIEAGIY